MRSSSKVQNFHVPLTKQVYQQLRSEALRSKRPATEIAREAIESCLEQRRRKTLAQEIARYAAAHANTPADLDPGLEGSGVEDLLDSVEESK